MREAVRREVQTELQGARDALRLHVPPEPTFVRYVRNRVAEFAASRGVAGEDLIDFLTAMGEAVANAVEHAHSREPIEIACWMVGERQILATVVDAGIGFESAMLLASDAALPDPLAVRGRGLALMRQCTDLFSVRSAPGSGTAVILGRLLHQHSA